MSTTNRFKNIRDIYGYPVYEHDIGDEVIFVRPHYHDLVVGKIIRLTSKGIKVEWSENGGVKERFVPEHNFVDISQFTK